MSYAHDDKDLVYPLLALLNDAGIRVWYDEGINPGHSWREEIGRAISNSTVVVYFVTPAASESRNCQREIGYALDRDKRLLVVHLVETQLSHGLTMSLADQQAILAHKLPQHHFEEKLLQSVERLLERDGVPAAGAAPTTRPSWVAALTRPLITAIGYVLLGTLLVLGASRLAARGGIADWSAPLLTTLLALGFIPTLWFAWRKDRRTRRVPTWIGWCASAISAVACGAVIWTAWSGAAVTPRESVKARAPPKNPVIAVAALQNLTGDPQLDWLSEGVANLVRDGLAESHQIVAVSPTRWQSVVRSRAAQQGSAPDRAALLSAALKAGIDYVVTGEYLRGPDGIILTARLSDVASAVETEVQRRDSLTPETMLAEADKLIVMVKRGLGIPHTERVAGWSADFAVANSAAYELYVSGLSFFLKFDYRQAANSFRASLELAPQFHMARYRLAHVQVASGDTAAALATLAMIPADAPLSPRERVYIDGAKALFARDPSRAIAVYKKLLEQLPFDVEARWLLATAHDMAFENEAAVVELRKLISQEPENDYFWSYLGETYLRLGEHDKAREALNHYLQYQPRDPYGLTVLGQLEQLGGSLDAAVGYYGRALEIQRDFVPARLGIGQSELLRDNWTAAETVLQELVGDAQATPAVRIDAAFDLAALLRSQGRFTASLQPLEVLAAQIEDEQVREAKSLSERGQTEAERGRWNAAETLIDAAIRKAPGGAPTRYLFARAQLRLKRGDVASAQKIAAAIAATAPPADSTQNVNQVLQNATRAATWLQGVIELKAGRVDAAVATLTRAQSLPGYQYALYRAALARAQLAAGHPSDALTTVRAALAERDPGEPRLDLELDRVRARVLEAEILTALGRTAESASIARDVLRRWSNAEPQLPELAIAKQLATATAVRNESAPRRQSLGN